MIAERRFSVENLTKMRYNKASVIEKVGNMIEIPFVPTEIAFAALWLVLRIAVWLRQKRIDWKREALLLLMYVNLAVLLRLTFFPMGRVNGRVQPLVLYTAAVYPFRINWIPLVRLRDFARKQDLLLNVVGNAVMFIPSGIILPVVYPRLNRFWKVLLAGIGLSLVIELLQLPFSVRASDVDDLLLNTLGAILGYGIYAAVRCWRRRSRRACLEHRD